jgi:hypothetical protein
MENKKVNGKKMSKKEARETVYNKLVSALSEFKPDGKAKRFEDNLRKTSKLFADYIIKADHKSKATKIEKGEKQAS